MRKLILAAAAIAFGWSSGVSALPANNPITAGLVAAYEFNGNADDVSGNGNDGVVYGPTLAADRFGNLGSAYLFDGTGNILVSNPSGLQSTNTVSVWTQLNFVEGNRYPIDLDIGEGNNNWIEIFEGAVFRTGNSGSFYFDTDPISPNAWHMLTRTYDGSTLSAYIDGQLVGSQTGPSNSPTGITIASAGDGSHGFIGFLDDVYIYDRALSASEVSTLYSAVPEPSTALLLGLGLVGIAARGRVSCSE